jgi:hypothetical protein
MEKNRLYGWQRSKGHFPSCLADAKRRIRVKDLPWLHHVIETNVQESLDIATQIAQKVLKSVCKTLNLSSLRQESHDHTIAKQELVAKLILSERDVRGLYSIL